ncbi:DUF4917 family protein [Rhodoferax ferrireducens]|uniref:DUF4917 family protein n=1 Tax=Rhodoferax ferrireducens TaxID=192843 RepID=UPI000E0D0BCE|nr:DUF4917 family protein [Rhodoferax ferrireducens]
MPIYTFQQALSEAQRIKNLHVLLGNGFSIACRPNIFLYGKLYEKADFSKLSSTAKKAFEALGTQDFERVIKALRDAKLILESYGGTTQSFLDTLQADADGLRELLVQTIAHSHPAYPGEIEDQEYAACRVFIANFKTVYTFNYDLLLYWAQMHTHDGASPSSDDGFRKSEDDYDAAYVVWEPSQSHEQNTWFLHGALHVFDAGTEVQKYTWTNTGVRLIDQIRNALGKGLFPLFVSEGTSAEKLARIRHSDYLAKAYRSFSEITGALFIYGHSLAENDEHYLQRIERGKLSQLYIGLYSDPNSDENKLVIRRANQMTNNRRPSHPLSVSYFDASTANVWGK